MRHCTVAEVRNPSEVDERQQTPFGQSLASSQCTAVFVHIAVDAWHVPLCVVRFSQHTFELVAHGEPPHCTEPGSQGAPPSGMSHVDALESSLPVSSGAAPSAASLDRVLVSAGLFGPESS
jgi:hypothetical protein